MVARKYIKLEILLNFWYNFVRKDKGEIIMIKWYKIRKFFYRIKNFPRKVKWFIQRGKRGYADCDLWNFDTYLEKIISKGLRELSRTTHGYPVSYETFENWQAQLNNIADLVEKFNPDNCLDWEKDISRTDWEDADEEAAIAREVVFDWFKNNWCSLWD